MTRRSGQATMLEALAALALLALITTIAAPQLAPGAGDLPDSVAADASRSLAQARSGAIAGGRSIVWRWAFAEDVMREENPTFGDVFWEARSPSAKLSLLADNADEFGDFDGAAVRFHADGRSTGLRLRISDERGAVSVVSVEAATGSVRVGAPKGPELVQ